MTTKKVPFVVYEDGVRKVIGEAVVDTDDLYAEVTAKITDPAYHSLLSTLDVSTFSLGNSEAGIIAKELYVKQKDSKKTRSSASNRDPKRRKQRRSS